MAKTNGIEQQAADAKEYVMRVEDGLKKVCDGFRALAALAQSRQGSDDDDELSAPTAARESHSYDVVNVLNDLLDGLVRNNAEASFF